MEEAKNYIKQQLEAGASRETIEKSLEEKGWTREDIQNAFADFDVPKVNEKLQLENAQVSESEVGKQNEIETKEIKSFRSLTAWLSIILSIILGVIIIYKMCSPGSIAFYFWEHSGTTGLGAVYALIVWVLTIVFSSLVIIIGIWWGTREKIKITFLNFLFKIVIIVIFCSLFVIGFCMLFDLHGNFASIFMMISGISLVLVFIMLSVIILISKIVKKINNPIFTIICCLGFLLLFYHLIFALLSLSVSY